MDKTTKRLIKQIKNDIQDIILTAVTNEEEKSKEQLIRDMIDDLCSVRDSLRFLIGESVLNTEL